MTSPFSGAFIWFTFGSEKEILSDFSLGIGIFLFIVGIVTFTRKISRRESNS